MSLRLRRYAQPRLAAVVCFALLASLAALIAPVRTAGAQSNPNQGPGGPILVITSPSATFSNYYAEILRTEGLNAFAVADISTVTSSMLSAYDVVILGKVALTSSQVTTLTNWVNAGGNLIAMDPDPQLAGLLGIAFTGSTLSNGYLLVDTSTKVGNGIVGETIQFHGTAQRYVLSGAQSLATLYLDATTPTDNPAITLRSVGVNGGQAAAFAYDLATSIVLTRQGNPAWVGQDRDGQPPTRSNDLFFGNAAFDPQPDWIDRNKVAIPQADEQQRLLVNLILHMNLDRKPLPRFWYLPHGHRAAVILTGDDHASGGTASQFDRYAAASPPNCSVADWECVRATSYIFPNTPLTNSAAAAYNAAGFEIGVHINTGCASFTESSLAATYADQISDWSSIFWSLPAPITQRHHCIAWGGWVTPAKVQLANGIRLDTNYYYWPPEWVANTPGHFTGSAMPMRFVDLDGTIIDVYQAVTQLTDESGQEYPFTIDTLLDRALGPEEHYGVYTVNAHTDAPVSPEGDAVVQSALERGVPVVAARQMLTWLDGRNGSSFGSLAFSNGTLTFTITRAAGANGLTALVPRRASGGRVLGVITRNGNDVPYEVVSVKGVEYASFPALSGSYVATYADDVTVPTVAVVFPPPGASGVSPTTNVRVTFSEAMDPSTINSGTFELRTASGTPVAATVTYSQSTSTAVLTPTNPLEPQTTYTATIHGGSTEPTVKDPAGNPLANSVTWSFTTAEFVDPCPCTIWPASATPSVPADPGDDSAVTLGVKFRSTVNGYIRGIRFYKGPGNSGPHVGYLWSSAGQLLASATFTSETQTGWQQVEFATPVPITANTTYVAAYHAPNGHYAVDVGYFATTGVTNDMLHAPSSVAAGGNGVFKYGAPGLFPDESWEGANYWVDVVFALTPIQGPDTTPPAVTITSPTSGTTYVTGVSPLNLGGTASDNVGVTEVTWSNDRGGSGTALGTTTWSTLGITLQPGTNVITVTARDAADNTGTDVLTVNYTPDTTPPAITERSPASGATGVAVSTAITVTFSEPMDSSTVNSNTIELRNSANQLVPATVTYDGSTLTATLRPSSALALSSTYTVIVKGGTADPRVKDLAGNALAANDSWSFTTASDECPCSLWPASATPSVPADPGDDSAVTLGVKFRSDVDGFITGIRFYKGPGNTGPHVGYLWSSTGQLLASATFTSETETGWQQAEFATPVPITANTTYIAAYHAPNGRYAADTGYFNTQHDNGVLHAPSSVAAGGNGVFKYGAPGLFPDETWEAANYWVDAVFVRSVSSEPDTTPPTITSRSPASGASGVNIGTTVRVTFSEPVDASTVNAGTFELRNAADELVPATVTYDAATRTAILTPTSALALATTYTATVRGGTTDPRVKDLAGNALETSAVWSFTTTATDPCAANPITAENCLPGNPPSEWDISGAGDPSIQGFATQISVNRGETIQFKVDTDATSYRFDIYRLGYYGGMGARKIATVLPSVPLPQSQPSCLTQPSTGLIDCGNWAVSGSWTVPANATSGIYIAKLVRTDTGGASHIVFIVRDDSSTSDLVFQTSDTTWQAYNTYGGNSLYQGSPGTNPGRAYKVSYNRPFITRSVDGGQDWLFNAEYPMVRWLEANGYDVTYISGVDTHRAGSLLLNHKVFLSVGHDEYWSAEQRLNVEAARDAGAHLAFFSGNEIFWKIRWENSIDGSGTPFRTLVCYKETHANAKIDPTSTWTGTWRDTRFGAPAGGARPENSLTGTWFLVNSGTSGIRVPAELGKMRLWRNTSIANLAPGQVATLPDGTLGYEWDVDPDNGARPAGLIRLSETTVPNVEVLQDFGSSYGLGTATHSLTLYRHSNGALVFGAGTIQWSWGLDENHDRAGTPSDVRMQQATVNLLADMGVQPATLQPGLVPASASTDTVAPTSAITAPSAGSEVQQNSLVVISGTATDTGGGVVGGVEVSVDGGATWRRADGRETWTYAWTPSTVGQVTILSRAIDDSGNIGAPGSGITVTVTPAGPAGCPCSLWPVSATPSVPADPGDDSAVTLGVKFRSDVDGFITGIRFYKGPGNTGPHVGYLWSSTGQLLASVTFTSETETGWQQAEFATPVPITANTTYIAAYHAPNGRYAADTGYFNTQHDNGVLHAPSSVAAGGNGVFKYGAPGLFPDETWEAANYWVDVVFTQ